MSAKLQLQSLYEYRKITPRFTVKQKQNGKTYHRPRNLRPYYILKIYLLSKINFCGDLFMWMQILAYFARIFFRGFNLCKKLTRSTEKQRFDEIE